MAEEKGWKWTLTWMVVWNTWKWQMQSHLQLCDKEIQMASGGVHALLKHASKNIHKQKATFHFASTYTKKDSEQHESQTTEQPSVPSSSGQCEMESMSSEVSQQGAKQASIKDFFMRTNSGDQPKRTEIECKASDNIPFRTTDGIPELFQRMFVDSTIA